MILAIDVAYNDNNIAQAVAVGFQKWDAQNPDAIYKEFIMGLEPYQPGEFFRRELPCIEKVLAKINLNEVEVIVIDGYVFLSNEQKPGLGAHLYYKLDEKIPIIGVAKSLFVGNEKCVEEIFRGESRQPLYVSAIGIDASEAVKLVLQMHGKFRIPTLLRQLDQLTRR